MQYIVITSCSVRVYCYDSASAIYPICTFHSLIKTNPINQIAGQHNTTISRNCRTLSMTQRVFRNANKKRRLVGLQTNTFNYVVYTYRLTPE